MPHGSCCVEIPSPNLTERSPNGPFTDLAQRLLETFGVPFYLFSSEGDLLYHHPEWPPPPSNWGKRVAQQAESANTQPPQEPKLLVYEKPLLVLGMEINTDRESPILAVGVFSTSRLVPTWILKRRLLRHGFRDYAQILCERLLSQPAWSKDTILRTARLFLAHNRLLADKHSKEKECQALAAELAGTYEEISLLHRLTQNLRISQTDEELASLALEGMLETVPAEGLAILLLPPETPGGHEKGFLQAEGSFFTRGNCPVEASQLLELAAELKVAESTRPIVCNRRITQQPAWRYPEIRELIMAPLIGGKECFGFLAVFNHSQGKEFGTVEASLVGSIAAILGSHSSNLLLYRQQEESLAGIIRALTAAIDAKDAYTCGHSDRVARVAVRLAQELGVEPRLLHTIYLAGLLHDIGKIGTSEAILRKPGKLTDEEYEHIKQHPRIGYRILMDLKHLSGVLPAVLHHHERWDGGGYPAGLAGEEIPLAARIIAVADAFDAMGSNRAYRSRLPDEKIDAILREGAGKQWDPAVIEAFFRIRDELDAIVQEERSAREEQQFFLPTTSTVNGAIPAAVLAAT